MTTVAMEARWRRIATFLERTLGLSRGDAMLRARLMSDKQLTEHLAMMLTHRSPRPSTVAQRKLRANRRAEQECVECSKPSETRRCEDCNEDRKRHRRAA